MRLLDPRSSLWVALFTRTECDLVKRSSVHMPRSKLRSCWVQESRGSMVYICMRCVANPHPAAIACTVLPTETNRSWRATNLGPV
eukprot:5675544-Pyramimonas_sp.AAC.1